MGSRATTYDLLAALFEYPDTEYPAVLNRSILALENGKHGDSARFLLPLRERIVGMSEAELQEMYTRTFDINPVCTLEVGWHVYGEDYARGAFLVKMRGMLREHGLQESTELPDHLTHVVALLGRLEEGEADHLAATYLLPALKKMLDGMGKAKDSEQPYRGLLETVWAVVKHDHDVELVPARERRGDPPDWNRRLPMVGGLPERGGREQTMAAPGHRDAKREEREP